MNIKSYGTVNTPMVVMSFNLLTYIISELDWGGQMC